LVGAGDSSETAEARRAAAFAELIREIGTDHPLYERIEAVDAFFDASDDVLGQLDDGTFALDE
jgi:hypothetical protein